MKIKTLLNYFLGPVGSGIFGFVLVPFLAWNFDTNEIGKYSMFQVYLGLFVLIFTLGLDHSYVRFFQETNNKASLFSSLFIVSLSFSIFFISIILISNQSLISELVIKLSNPTTSVLIALSFIMAITLRFIPLVLRMNEAAFKYSVIELFQKGSLLFLIFISLYCFKSRNSFETLLYCYVFSGLLTICLSVSLVMPYITSMDKLHTSLNFFGPHLRYGLPLAITGFASWGLVYADRFVLESLASFDALGVYTVAISISGVVSLLTAVFSIVWAPAVYKWVSNGVAVNELPDKCKLICYVSLMIVSLVGMFSWSVKYLLPIEYHMISIFITLNVSFHIYFVLAEAFGIGINISKKSYLITVATLFSCLINLGLSYLLIPNLGIVGAAISSSLSAFIFFLTRSELSILVWDKVIERRDYIYPSLCYFIMLSQALFGDKHLGLFTSLYFFLFIGLAIKVSRIVNVAYLRKSNGAENNK